MSLLHSSTRRPAPLKDTDYDHSINLIDHTTTSSTRALSADDASRSPELSGSSSRPQSESGLGKGGKLHREITRRKYAKYQDRREEVSAEDGEPEECTLDASDLGEEGEVEERGRTISGDGSKRAKNQVEPESAIDILYENQRGLFLCGIPFFSGKALGNIDPSQWTNVALKPSATNTSNAQVPDPTWEWTWREWTVNHTDEVDEDGWEYSFMFSHKFSWHGPSWWNSFVRRRAWIRKRTKKHFVYTSHDPNMLSSTYFTVQPSQDRSRSRASTKDGSVKHYSVANSARRHIENGVMAKDIQDINSLMVVLRYSRIDREKMEAVESFISHGTDELYHLKERMHEIMGQFIFQASRRLLLAHIVKIFNEESDQLKEIVESENDAYLALRQRLDNLEAAIKAADDEVKRLEYWSDVKDMVENGETKGAVDDSQGWDKRWTGLDLSGPKDVISDRDLSTVHSGPDGKENGTPIDSSAEEGKGKGKSKEI